MNCKCPRASWKNSTVQIFPVLHLAIFIVHPANIYNNSSSLSLALIYHKINILWEIYYGWYGWKVNVWSRIFWIAARVSSNWLSCGAVCSQVLSSFLNKKQFWFQAIRILRRVVLKAQSSELFLRYSVLSVKLECGRSLS